ncbi:MAG: hypothetical protein ACYCVB_16735 [Bacilli bacterium]
MRGKVLILDTSMLCCWLQVPGKETCGSRDDTWDKARVDSLLNGEIQKGATLVLPLATIIETGNHISQSPRLRYETAQRFGSLIMKTAERRSPWAAFSDQSALWSAEQLKHLAETWPDKAAQRISIGDAMIIAVAEYYSKIQSIQVEILTGDAGLKAYQAVMELPKPRRRKH